MVDTLPQYQRKALKKKLIKVDSYLKNRRNFIKDYSEIYKFNKTLTRYNLARYERLIKAIETLVNEIDTIY